MEEEKEQKSSTPSFKLQQQPIIIKIVNKCCSSGFDTGVRLHKELLKYEIQSLVRIEHVRKVAINNANINVESIKNGNPIILIESMNISISIKELQSQVNFDNVVKSIIEIYNKQKLTDKMETK